VRFDLDPHPALERIAYRTIACSVFDRLIDIGESARHDPAGRVVRVWVTCDPGEAPDDCRGEEET